MWQVSFQMDVQLVSKHGEKVCIIKTTEFWTWVKALERISHVQRYKVRERLLGKAGCDKGAWQMVSQVKVALIQAESGFGANLTPPQYLLWNSQKLQLELTTLFPSALTVTGY